MAISSASRTSSLVMRLCIDQPTTLRENRSRTTARYNQPLVRLDVSNVGHPTFIRLVGNELPIELVGHDHVCGFHYAAEGLR